MPFVDNRPALLRGRVAAQGGIHVDPLGGHFVTRLGANGDATLWYAWQTGKWGGLTHRAIGLTAEVGYRFNDAPWKPWLRAGYARSSGDDDANDGTHHTFFQMLPTARVYAFSTFYNLMNTEDASVELLLRPRPGLTSRTEWHNLRLTEANDLWYQGAGATIGDRNRAEGFGYSGRPANGFRELFSVVQTSLSYDWNAYVNTNVYYGHVFGGEVVDRIFDNDMGDFGYIELMLKI